MHVCTQATIVHYFNRKCVSFVVAFIYLYNLLYCFVCVIVFSCGICVVGSVAGPPSSVWDQQGQHKSACFFLKYATYSLQNRRSYSLITHV